MNSNEYNKLQFEKEPTLKIKKWEVHPLSEEGIQDYLSRESHANTFLKKPTIKMVRNLYAKEDNYNHLKNCPNNRLDQVGDIYDSENLNNVQVEDYNGSCNGNEEEENKEEGEEQLNSPRDDNQNNVGFRINDWNEEEMEKEINENNFNSSQNNKTNFYKSTSNISKRSHPNIFKTNSNGVERILGSNELNFRVTTNNQKINKIYNNSLKNYENSLKTPFEVRYSNAHIKDLEAIYAKIDAPDNFFGFTPTSNIYLLSKRKKSQGKGFESFNVPRTQTLRRSCSEISETKSVRSHCTNIMHSLKVSNKTSTNKKRNASVEIPIDQQEKSDVINELCQSQNNKIKNIIANSNIGTSNFGPKLPKISAIINQPKLFLAPKQKHNGKVMGEKYNPFSYGTKSLAPMRNTYGGTFQY